MKFKVVKWGLFGFEALWDLCMAAEGDVFEKLSDFLIGCNSHQNIERNSMKNNVHVFGNQSKCQSYVNRF